MLQPSSWLAKIFTKALNQTLTLVCSLWGDLDTRKTAASKLASLKPVAKAFFINWSYSAGDGIKSSLAGCISASHPLP